MRVEFNGPQAPRTRGGVLIAFALEGEGLAVDHGELEEQVVAPLRSALSRNSFTGKAESLLPMAGPPGLDADYVVVSGLGSRKDLTPLGMEEAAARAYASVADREFDRVELLLGAFSPAHAAHAALGVELGRYRFDKHHTVKVRKPPSVLRISTADAGAAEAAYAPLAALAAGVRLARDLVSEPPNLLYPASFVERLGELEEKGVEVAVLNEDEMAERGMGLLLAVGRGSARESRLAVCTWRGAADPDAPPLVLVGKGVTFDSGGLSLKPTKDMEPMKYDMSGAAAVVGALLVLAQRKAAANVVGVLGLVENMPDGAAMRPSDILTSMSGKTVEVVNTDAEGRLVLADALWFSRQSLAPRAMIDLATLTGHASYALGADCAALLSNSDDLSAQLVAAGAAENEMLWRLPLIAAYDKLHDTPDADMKHVGGHPEAGAITAALFLQRFVEDTPWAHLDIAAVALRSRDDRATLPKGATGWGVRTLNRLVADHFEDHR